MFDMKNVLVQIKQLVLNLQGVIKRERKRKGPDRERIRVKKRWGGGVCG